MNLLNKMERRFGRYAIRNLPLIMIILQVIGYTMSAVAPGMLNWICFSPYYICRGQVWRLLTWVLMPPSGLSIFTVIMLFFYYWIARMLASTWGDFYFNVYIIGGVLITDIGMMIAYPILQSVGSQTAMLNIALMSSYVTTYYIQTSILLAFAFTFPDTQVLLYFFIPIKMSWLGIFEGIMLAYDFYRVGMAVPRLVILLSVINFILYFLSTRNMRRYSPKEVRRRASFRRASQGTSGGRTHAGRTSGTRSSGAAASGRPASGAPGSGSISRRNAGDFAKVYPGGARHRCTICGRTELDDDSLEFRFCSKCEGNYEYCQDHLFTHSHIRNGVPTSDPQ